MAVAAPSTRTDIDGDVIGEGGAPQSVYEFVGVLGASQRLTASSSQLRGGEFPHSSALYSIATQSVNIQTDFASDPSAPTKDTLSGVTSFEVRAANSFTAVLGGRSALATGASRGFCFSLRLPQSQLGVPTCRHPRSPPTLLTSALSHPEEKSAANLAKELGWERGVGDHDTQVGVAVGGRHHGELFGRGSERELDGEVLDAVGASNLKGSEEPGGGRELGPQPHQASQSDVAEAVLGLIVGTLLMFCGGIGAALVISPRAAGCVGRALGLTPFLGLHMDIAKASADDVLESAAPLEEETGLDPASMGGTQARPGVGTSKAIDSSRKQQEHSMLLVAAVKEVSEGASGLRGATYFDL